MSNKFGKCATIDLIKKGQINVLGEIERFEQEGVRLRNGSVEKFDAVILATGYRAGLESVVELHSSCLDEKGSPKSVWFDLYPNLCFLGFNIAFSGILNSIYEESAVIYEELRSRLA